MVKPVAMSEEEDVPISYGTEEVSTVPPDAGKDESSGVTSINSSNVNDQRDTIELTRNDTVNDVASIPTSEGNSGNSKRPYRKKKKYNMLAVAGVAIGLYYLFSK